MRPAGAIRPVPSLIEMPESILGHQIMAARRDVGYSILATVVGQRGWVPVVVTLVHGIGRIALFVQRTHKGPSNRIAVLIDHSSCDDSQGREFHRNVDIATGFDLDNLAHRGGA